MVASSVLLKYIRMCFRLTSLKLRPNTFYSYNYGAGKALLRQHQRPVNTPQNIEGGELDDVSFTNHMRKGD